MIEEEEGSGGDPFEDDVSISSELPRDLMMIRENDSYMTSFRAYDYHRDINSAAWARIGRDISNNTHLIKLQLCHDVLNEQKMRSLFSGLTRSNTIKDIRLTRNGFGTAGVRSMVPFLQNSNSLQILSLNGNNIQSEGFNVLFRALSDSPIEMLNCNDCGIASIDIVSDHIPRNLRRLSLSGNIINADGCREIGKLLRGGNATLEHLDMSDCKIDDDGVEILVDALQSNTLLASLDLGRNGDISNQGLVMLLKLVNDISSITATLQSNHTLENIYVYWREPDEMDVAYYQQRHNIQLNIDNALAINKMHDLNPQAAGREKMIQFQLRRRNRAVLAALQGIEHSVYSEIDPLHLPEVLSLLSRRPYAQGELFGALRSTVVVLFSMVNMRQCIQNQAACCAAKIDEYEAKIDEYKAKMNERGARLKELNARLEAMDDSNQINAEDVEVHNNKRRRV